ncbi:protocadherin-15-like isoform X4 [Acanthaster planci]|uniref:Protocadherin-15-like isoform X4 n=1 Tax=Acanthaster planci TaxID=133434 RepID=A0A8B7Z8Z8_ACAPL|nr:protocadherin-15-like isoform X4 [Acanthaster planci]
MTTTMTINRRDPFMECLLFILLLWGITQQQCEASGSSRGLDCLRNDGGGDIISFSLSEDALPGHVIGVLPLKGEPAGDNATIRLTISPSPQSQFVLLNVSDKALLLAQQVDPDLETQQSRLGLQLQCEVLNFGIPLQFDYRINIDILNVNDNTPVFLGLPYQANISELAQVDTIIFSGIRATDMDGANSNGQVIYSVEYNPTDPDASDYFTIKNGGIGAVSLLRPLDYETKRTWEVLIRARDNGPEPRSNTTVLFLNVLDGEDLPPQFLPCNFTRGSSCEPVTYSTTILEKANMSGPLVFEPGPIRAMDADLDVATNGPIQYTLSDGFPPEYIDYFRIDSETGEVFLLQPVYRADFKEFTLQVTASESPAEGGLYAITSATVTVQEVNEHRPVFAQDYYQGYVYENSRIGTQVSMSNRSTVPLKLHASDMDIAQGRPLMLSYYLSDATAHFILEAGPDGSFAYVVVSSNQLDREVANNYTIRVLAVENDTFALFQSEEAVVDITVLDVNDKPPEFVPNEYSTGENRYRATVEENAEAGTVIMTLSTTDMDLPPYEPVEFVINYIDNDGETKFGLAQSMPSSVNIILEENGTILEGEEYSISMQAIDGGISSLMSEFAYIEITVLPANVSHAPTFEQPVYEASASEGLPEGAFVTTVTATDRDEGDTVYYNITAGNIDNVFTVDSGSGEVKLVGTLNREAVASYELTIQASDGALSSTCILQITILDVNDNNPVFNASLPAEFLVLEGLADEFVGQVMASDMDEPDTPNSNVQYSLVSDAFRIDPDNGMIFTVGALDREQQDRYVLDVVATDQAASPRSTTLQVVVVVEDVNDNSPVFEPKEYSVNVMENLLAQDFLVLQALDRDAAAVLEYLITSGDTQTFTIVPETGSLSLLKTLDYEAMQTYTLEVTARDTENASAANATATVTVNVLDENDHDPVFTMTSYEGAVLRTADLGTVAASGIRAVDGDLADTANGQVFYNLMPASVYFTILDPSEGVVVTKTSLQNAPDVNNLTVVAYDNGNPSRSQTASLIIRVRMERPVFPQSVYMVDDLKEEEPPGTKVIELRASANQGDQIEYEIIAGDPDGKFELVSQENIGTIQTLKVLDRENVSSYSLMVRASVVEATTGGGNRRKRRQADTNVVEVVIDLVDINDNVPAFEKTAYFVGVSDSAGIGTTVITMKAIDQDGGNNSVIDYSMQAKPASSDNQVNKPAADSFTIDASTGVIKTAVAELAAEPRTFTYSVFGRERLGPPENAANTTVTISLVNEDNRVILATSLPPSLLRENQALLEAALEELLGAEVVIEDIGVRLYGDNLEKSDPSGSDVQFYAINVNTGEPFTTDELIQLLQNVSQLDAVLRDISPDGNGRVIEVRKPRTGQRPVTSDAEPTVEAIALLCLAVALFILCILAIAVVVVSWKKVYFVNSESESDVKCCPMWKRYVSLRGEQATEPGYSLVLGYRREMEREKQARLYLPVYNTFNPYSTAEDHEIPGTSVPDGRIFTTPSAANPVYFDDHAVQVNPRSACDSHSSLLIGAGQDGDERGRLLFEEGAPSFLKPRETQEHTMDFDDEMSSEDLTDEATAAANSIAAAVRSGSSRKSSKRSKRSSRSSSRSKTPSSSGPPSYSSSGTINKGNTSSPPSKIHEVSTIPYRNSETPREPLRPPPLFDPRPSPTSDPRSPFESGGYDNLGADVEDGFGPVGSPISGARTNSSLSTHKPGSLEGRQRNQGVPLKTSYFSHYKQASKNDPATANAQRSEPWEPSDQKLSHVALEDNYSVKLVHMENKPSMRSHPSTPSRDGRKSEMPSRRGSRRKHKRAAQPHSHHEDRRGSTSSDDGGNGHLSHRGGQTNSWSRSKPARSSSRSRKLKRRTSGSDSNFSFGVADGKKGLHQGSKDNDKNGVDGNNPDILQPIYQYTQPPWNELDIINTVL